MSDETAGRNATDDLIEELSAGATGPDVFAEINTDTDTEPTILCEDPCDQCGGIMKYDPEHHIWVCQECFSERPLDVVEQIQYLNCEGPFSGLTLWSSPEQE